MKFRKEYQTYLLIVIAIITAGYFLKPFFFNKKKKVVEGQEGQAADAYKDDVGIMALIAAANLLTILGQPTTIDYNEAVVTTATTAATAANAAATTSAAAAAYAAANAAYAAYAAANPKAMNAAYAAANAAANAAGYADAYANDQTDLIITTIRESANYKKVMTTYNNNPANLKTTYITAASLIDQSVFETKNKI